MRLPWHKSTAVRSCNGEASAVPHAAPRSPPASCVSLWQQHQRQLQLQEEQRERVQGQLLQVRAHALVVCSLTSVIQFNDAQKKKDVDRLRPGLQLDARWRLLPLLLLCAA